MLSDVKPYLVARTLLAPWMKKHLEVLGSENLPLKTPFLLGVNHIDWLDGLYVAYAASDVTYRRVYFLSATNNYWMFRTTIKVDRSKPRDSLHYANNVLKHGHCVCIFPEGKRNTSQELLEGKTGLARLAMATRLPMIPVGLSGPSGESFMDSIRLMNNRQEKVVVRFGQPITYWEYYRREATPDIIGDVTRHIMQSIGHLAGKTYAF